MRTLSLLKIKETDFVEVSSMALIKGGDDPVKFECGNNGCTQNSAPCKVNNCKINEFSCDTNNCGSNLPKPPQN